MDGDAGAGVVVSLASSSPSAISSSFALLALQHRGEREKRGGGGRWDLAAVKSSFNKGFSYSMAFHKSQFAQCSPCVDVCMYVYVYVCIHVYVRVCMCVSDN